MTTRLNLGAGNRPIPGWINVDANSTHPKVRYMDLNNPKYFNKLRDGVDEFAMVHVIEHLWNPLKVMKWCWDWANPDALMHVIAPYGGSDSAWEDPTHTRPYFHGSWAYFGQPWHWMNPQSGYTADWRVEEVQLVIADENYVHEQDTMWHLVDHERNWVEFQHVKMRAVKPARPAVAELVEPTPVTMISFTDYANQPWVGQFHRDPTAAFDE